MQDVRPLIAETDQARRDAISVRLTKRRWIMLAGHCVPFIVPGLLALLIFRP